MFYDTQAAAPETPWAFRLENISKIYPLYTHPLERLRELFGGGVRHREFVALHPLTLEIQRGSSLGIVGDNGAGKSTLMHLLAGSHQSSSGQVLRNGKVLGLLELGVGFHADFSGHDNIFFYADMLGLERAFVAARYDEIIAFAEIGEFIDQPLRTYSTGMRVRLAFALVACLDPDILIVDEALSVGDIHFQKKCIDRMNAFRRAGKTIILCSHSLYQVSTFCDEVIWMQGGRIRLHDTPEVVLPAYEAYQMGKRRETQTASRNPDAPARIHTLRLASDAALISGADLDIEWQVEAATDTRYHLSFSLKMDDGRGVFVTGTALRGEAPFCGSRAGRLHFPATPLMGGEYAMHMRVWDDEGLVLYDEELLSPIRLQRDSKEMGIVRLPCQWHTHEES